MNRITSSGEARKSFDTPRLMSLDDTAKYLGISYWHVRDLIDKGKLPKVQLGRRVLIDLRDADSLIEKSKDRNI